MSTSVQQHDPQVSDPASSEPNPDDGLSAAVAPHERRRSIVQTLVWMLVFASLYCGFAWWRTGSASLIVPYLRGERLLIQPMGIDLGSQTIDTIVDLPVKVVNATGSDIAFVGAQKSCGCISLDAFPLTVGAGETRELKISVGMPRRSGSFEQSVKFFTDYDSPSTFAVTVTANVQ